jgi:hypothetical protein
MTIDKLVEQFEEIGIKDFYSRVQMRIMLRVLGEQVSEIRLSGNRRLNDATDFRELLMKLADAMHTNDATDFRELLMKLADAMHTPNVRPRTILQNFCNGCGHIHQGDGECAMFMGSAGYCGCKEEVAV